MGNVVPSMNKSRQREMTNAHESMDPHDQLVTEQMTRLANMGFSRLTRAESKSKQLEGEKVAFQLVQRRLVEGKAHMTVTDSYGTWMTPVTLTLSVATPHHKITRSSPQDEGEGHGDLSTSVSGVDPAGRKVYHSKDSELGTAKCRRAHAGNRRCDGSSRRAGKYDPQMATSSAQTEFSQKEPSISETSTSIADGRDCNPHITSKHIERRHILQRVASPSRKSCLQKSVAACRLGKPVLKKRVRFKDVCEESNSPHPNSFEYGPCTLLQYGDLSLVQSQNQVSQIAGPCRRTGMANSRPNYDSHPDSWNLQDNIRRDPFPSGAHRTSFEKLAIRSIQIAGRQSRIRFSEVIQTFDPRVYESLQENLDGFGEVEEFMGDTSPGSSRSSYVYPPTDDPNRPPPSPPPSSYPPSPRRRSMQLDKNIMQSFDDVSPYRFPPSPPPSYPPSPGRRSLQTDHLLIQLPPPSPPYRHPLSDPKRRSILRNQSLEQNLPLRMGRSKSVTFHQGPDIMPLQLGRSKSVSFDEAPIQYITLPREAPISPYEMGDKFSGVLYDRGPVQQFSEDTERRLGKSPSQVPFDNEVYDERDSSLRLSRSNSGTFDEYGIRPPPLEMPISPYEMAEQFSDFSYDREPVEVSQDASRLGTTQSFDEVSEPGEPLRRGRSYSFDEFPRDGNFMRPPPLEIPNSPYETDERFSDVYYDRGSVEFSQEPHGQEEPVPRSSFPDYNASERESTMEEPSPNRGDSDKAKFDFRQELYQQAQETEETIFDLLSKTSAASKELGALERQERLSGHLQLKESGKESRTQDIGKRRSSSGRIADMSSARRISGSLLSKGMKEVNQTFDYNSSDPRRASSASTCEYCLDEANPDANSIRKLFTEKKTVTEADIYELIESFQVEMMKLMERTGALFASQEEEKRYNDEVQRVNDGIRAVGVEGGRE